MRIDRINDVTLYVSRDRRIWRRWWWAVVEPGRPEIDGRAWTREGAIRAGRVARAVRLATRRVLP